MTASQLWRRGEGTLTRTNLRGDPCNPKWAQAPVEDVDVERADDLSGGEGLPQPRSIRRHVELDTVLPLLGKRADTISTLLSPQNDLL